MAGLGTWILPRAETMVHDFNCSMGQSQFRTLCSWRRGSQFITPMSTEYSPKASSRHIALDCANTSLTTLELLGCFPYGRHLQDRNYIGEEYIVGDEIDADAHPFPCPSPHLEDCGLEKRLVALSNGCNEG